MRPGACGGVWRKRGWELCAGVGVVGLLGVGVVVVGSLSAGVYRVVFTGLSGGWLHPAVGFVGPSAATPLLLFL